MTKVSVCVAATRPDTVGATVRSIAAQTFRDWELVVIAQGPGANGVADAVEREVGDGQRARVLPQPGKGLSRARNAAVTAADGDVIAMIDDDCEAEPDWIEVIVDRFRAVPQAGIVGGAVVAPPARGARARDRPSFRPAERVFHPSTSPEGPP